MKNKMLALLTAVLLCVNLFPLAAFAANEGETGTEVNVVTDGAETALTENGDGASDPESGEAEESVPPADGEPEGQTVDSEGSAGDENSDSGKTNDSDVADGEGGGETVDEIAAGTDVPVAVSNEDAGGEGGDDANADDNGIMPMATEASGTFGVSNNLTWELDDAGVLTISGTGSTGYYDEEIPAFPAYSNDIKSLVVEEGVTDIGKYTFASSKALTEVTLPASLVSIGENAFASCTNLTSVAIRARDVKIADTAFESGNSGLVILGYTGSEVENYAERKGYDFKQIDVIDSGTCGAHLTWTLYDTGTLTISGEGQMEDYSFYSDGVTNSPWESYKGSIKTVHIGEGVTSIGDDAFYKCVALTGVTLPGSVASIGWGAFSDCTELSSVDIPEGVTYIGMSAFADCAHLSDLNLPTSLNEIGTCAFVNCDALTSVTIPEGVATIGTQVFAQCSSLTEITLPTSLKEIANLTFQDCTALTKINIPEGVTRIGTYVFEYCTALSSVTIPQSVAQVDEGAFFHCPQLAYVTIESENVEIGEKAFGYQTATGGSMSNKVPDFTIIGYPGSTAQTYAEENDFRFEAIGATDDVVASGTCGADLRWQLTRDGTLTITGTGAMTDYEADADVPWYDHAAEISAVMIEEGVTSIGSGAFSNLTGLETVAIPSTVTRIGMFAFQRCALKGDFVLSENVKYIGVNAFLGCDDVKSITVKAADVTLEPYAFGFTATGSGEEPVSGFVVKGCVDSTARKYAKENGFAFEPINAIAYGTCGADGDNLMWYLDATGTLLITGTGLMDNYDGMKPGTNGMPWYEYRHDIKAVAIEEGVTSIGTDAFWYFTSLTDVSIPESVTLIGDGAFTDCEALTEIKLPSGLTAIAGGTFDQCYALSSVVIPEQVTSIGASAFRQCYALTDVAIPKNVKNIGVGAFMACSNLNTITLPEGLATIDDSAFSGCSNLYKVTIYSRNADISRSAFTGAGSGKLVIYGYTGSTAETFAGANNIPFIALDGENSGKCGDNVIWQLSDDGVLTIFGTGPMYDYTAGEAPWFDHHSEIKTLIIEDGVTGIGDYAFYSCTGLTVVDIPDIVTRIGVAAFSDCVGLQKVTIGTGLTSLGDDAFYNDYNLMNYTIYATDADIGARSMGYWEEESGGALWLYLVKDAVIYGFDPSTAKTYAEGPHMMYYTIPFVSLGSRDGDTYTYRVLPEASDTEHWLASGSDVTIYATGRLKDFEELYVDGKLVAKEYYTAADGSTIITLVDTFLDTLSVGEHSADLQFTNGTAHTTITIKERKPGGGSSGSGQSSESDDSHGQPAPVAPAAIRTIPQTGDEEMLGMWGFMFLVSACGMAGLAVWKRKRQE